ncbi:TrmB family transcriptional regulator [Haloarcula marina]|uniref:TrmB family transcriptional regulator n=1 Tax=Haloarcula marina TaxID=2961574 RepID=UPI0020B6EE6E|nr:TrmB family transcriptional regulator sugar-binding domain-containing protein [Halomicroarcula marina]
MDTLVTQLQRFGFSEAEAETYRAALQLGQATVGEVAGSAGLSKGYAYDVIDDLAARGVLTVDDHMTPTQVRAERPTETVAEFEADLDRLETSLRDHYTHSDPDHPEVEVVKSRSPAERRLRAAIGNAAGNISLSVPAPAVERIGDELAAAADRGVFVRLLIGGAARPAAADPVAGRVDAARVWEYDVPFGLLNDRGTAMLGDPGVLYGQYDRGEFALRVANSPKLAGAVGALLANLWTSSREAFVGDADPLPSAYDSFTAAVFHATRHRRADRALEATVTLRSGETITGRVVDIEQAVIDPITAQFPLQNTMVLSTDDGEVTVGGPGAFIEEYSAARVELRGA